MSALHTQTISRNFLNIKQGRATDALPCFVYGESLGCMMDEYSKLEFGL